MLQRKKKLQHLLDSGVDPFADSYPKLHNISSIIKEFGYLSVGEEADREFSVAGRLMSLRRHGKASFSDLQDGSGRIQIYATQDSLGEEDYERFLHLDIGDWIGLRGKPFKTKRGELTLKIIDFELLTKSLRPLPEKWHGLKDVELRYRQRYVDLIVNENIREVFLIRSEVIERIRKFLNAKGYLEVETPMLQSIAGGAAAKPFITHHNALDLDLYLRIAPELYLKRLLVGGFEKVYEINRNFRNEGISVQHNPEFTMLELYEAFADFNTMLSLCEELVSNLISVVSPSLKINYQGEELDFKRPWAKFKMIDALKAIGDVDLDLDSGIDAMRKRMDELELPYEKEWGKGKLLGELFEKTVEGKIVQPTFITRYPTEISPLARASRDDPRVTDRFELLICGREIANAFSELTNPVEQRARLEEQLKRHLVDDEVAQRLDRDFIRALEYGMPPAGGMGIGIDRLVMILTDSASIRDVILFPQLKPEPE